jgi:hypothetical protein
MPVLVEANSIIVRVAAIHDRFAGGFAAFANDVPNSTLCSDGEVARVGFMNPNDGSDYIDRLIGFGLIFKRGEQCEDIGVAIQSEGLALPCDWLDYGTIEIAPGQSVCAVWLKGSAGRQVFCPERWSYEKSLSRQYTVVPPQHVGKALTFLRHDNGIDVYRDALTGKEVFIGRTAPTARG